MHEFEANASVAAPLCPWVPTGYDTGPSDSSTGHRLMIRLPALPLPLRLAAHLAAMLVARHWPRVAPGRNRPAQPRVLPGVVNCRP